MSSAICQNFVQNAWKKELCSNCFKSKDEHAERPKPKPIKLISPDRVEGIMKSGKKTPKPKRSVAFAKQLSEVIGYGGEDWESSSSSSSDEETSQSSEDDADFVAESEEEPCEKELKRLTKENTDFNANNLKENVSSKKVTSQLMLGKPLVDSCGRKQTLLVSVTPFGEESGGARTSTKFAKNAASHIPIARNKEAVIPEIGSKSNIILTSYTKNEEEKSLLDEISETLENGKNPIQIISRKKIQKEIILAVPRADNSLELAKKLKNEENTESRTKHSVAVPERKINLSRTPAVKHEKPLIYQTSTAKIELLTNKLQKNRENVNTSSSSSSTEKHEESFVESREQAGEPDGRADPVVPEPPALPLTPPPILEPSFLHSSSSPIYEKPKIPSKPSTVLIRKPVGHLSAQIEVKPAVLTTFASSETKGALSLDSEKPALVKQDSTGSDIARNKRKAPKPPPESDAVFLPEKRASSCSPKMRNSISGDPHGGVTPEAAPRKLLSVSTDNLAETEKRIKEKKGRFSLKKFLRMGTSSSSSSAVSKELISSKSVVDSPCKSEERSENGCALPPLPKPRLIIVHPSELNGAKVEVVAKGGCEYQNITMTRYASAENDYEPFVHHVKQKPPPPPRNPESSGCKPNLPPPKSVEIMNKQKQLASSPVSSKAETVYANIGEVRSAIVPNKPQRTASMRERELIQQEQQKKMLAMRHKSSSSSNNNNNYESVENVYDYIQTGTRSSSPESDSSHSHSHNNGIIRANAKNVSCNNNSGSGSGSPNSKITRLNKRCESSIDVSGEYFKFSNIPRSVSLTYCGSETESEIYSPYSFYGSESEITEDDHDWIQNGRTHKLRSRKGRSIVHKNLEDNYGAVIVANHEALAQVLENIQQASYIQPALRGLKSASSLRWTDFSIITPNAPLAIGSRTFHQALWNNQHVTLLINSGTAVPSSSLSLGALSLAAITEFSDLIPANFLYVDNDDNDKFVQATVGVLPWLNVSSIQSYSEALKSRTATQTSDEVSKDASFIMLQLVNALKILQAQGIEELSLSLNGFVLCKDMEKDTHYRLYVLQGLGEELNAEAASGTLCMCAAKAVALLQPTLKLAPLMQSLLSNERAVSLTQVKSILEFCLWGPSDVALGSTIRERELALQRWLDLQRATVLHGLVCARVQLTVYEECHLFFLVRSNARMMSDASLLLESSNMKHLMMSGRVASS